MEIELSVLLAALWICYHFSDIANICSVESIISTPWNIQAHIQTKRLHLMQKMCITILCKYSETNFLANMSFAFSFGTGLLSEHDFYAQCSTLTTENMLLQMK